MNDDPNPRSRLALMAAARTLSDADVRWFTRPYGLLELCRSAVQERSLDALNELPLDVLGEQLDDQSAAFGSQLPSQRIAALVAAAHIAAGHTDVRWRSRLTDGLGPLGGVAARDLVGYMNGTVTVSRAVASVPIAVSRHAFGELARFSVAPCLRDSEIGLDIVDAPFMRVDDEFVYAIKRSRVAVEFTGGARWMLASARTGQPVDAIAGASVALGAAVALGGLRPDADRFRADPTWVFTGDVDDTDGSVRALTGDKTGSEYANKLRALGERATLVFPEHDAAHVSSLELPNDGIKLAPVTTVDELVRTLERHAAGTAEYARVVSGHPPKRPRTKLLSIAAGAAAVVIAIIGLRNWNKGGDETRQQARSSVPPISVDPAFEADPAFADLGPFSIDVFEVSIKRYRECVEAGACAPPSGIAAHDYLLAVNDDFPATGLSVEDAEAFCEFLGMSLPTRDQYRFIAMHRQTAGEFPIGADASAESPRNELPAVIATVDDGAQPGQLRWATGNVREFTRTKCQPNGCTNLARVTNSGASEVFVFGLDYSLMTQVPAGLLDIGDEWLNTAYYRTSLTDLARKDPYTGFRCSQEDTA